MDVRPAKLIRFVDPTESADAVVNEAKGATWTHRVEHALLCVEFGRFALVSGGKDGIELRYEPPDVKVELDGKWLKVQKLAWHTHPVVTGPSDHDMHLLELLGQGDSTIYEMFGPKEGSKFWAKRSTGDAQ